MDREQVLSMLKSELLEQAAEMNELAEMISPRGEVHPTSAQIKLLKTAAIRRLDDIHDEAMWMFSRGSRQNAESNIRTIMGIIEAVDSF